MTDHTLLLANLLDDAISVEGAGDGIAITGLTADSRAVQQGHLFAALAGARTDGARFIADAVAKGAVAVLVADSTAISVPAHIAVLRSPEPRRALAQMAARFYGPGPQTIVAVTGTSGKTSVAEFTRQIFAHLGHKSASLGTLGLIKPGGAAYGSLTTPDPVTLARTLAELRSEGITHLAMEASSHGLDQFRIDAVRSSHGSGHITAGAFTNLGRDHMDYHPTVEHYLDAKLRLFRELIAEGEHGAAVINADGAYADAAIAAAQSRHQHVVTVGKRGETLKLLGVTRDGFKQRLTIEAEGRVHDILLPLVGAYQVENALVAAGCAYLFEGVGDVLAALEHLRGVPGRLDIVGEVRGGLAVVDYAHKPDALSAVLDALRPFATGKLICVFGCGGSRDTGKRPIMGRIAIEKADVTIVTDDNPRTERPEAIRAQVLAGAPGAREIGDRAAAIRAGVDMLGPGDVLVVAGKGHEPGQIVGDKVLPFSDHDELAKAIAALGPVSAAPPATSATAEAATASRLLPSPSTGEGPGMGVVHKPIETAVDTPHPRPSPARGEGRTWGTDTAQDSRTPLWSFDALVAAAGATADGMPSHPITGFSIDTRTLQPGDVFVALKDARDGHEFVAQALGLGAAAAIVADSYARQGDGALIRVDDPLRALEALGIAARARLAPMARVIAITGSAGKTGTTAMLRACLASSGAPVHAPEKSFNNHWGVPLTLARMPASTQYAIFEIGMNHAGEIRPLVKMVRPHIGIITNVLPVHVGNFPDGETGVARAKAEIVEGIDVHGSVLIPEESPHTALLYAIAREHGILAFGFGEGPTASVRMTSRQTEADGASNIAAAFEIEESEMTAWVVGAPGEHLARNSLAVAGAIALLNIPLWEGLLPLRQFRSADGRGARMELAAPGGHILLIDESYNANPASVAAALAAMTAAGRDRFPRRIAVLGDMLELGPDAQRFHTGLSTAVTASGADLVFACGPNMKLLFDGLPAHQRGHWAPASDGLTTIVPDALKSGDCVMIKGSLGSRMAPIVEAIKKRFAPAHG